VSRHPITNIAKEKKKRRNEEYNLRAQKAGLQL
jgi:hypothetical protein